jgi:flavodoxin
MKTLVLYDSMFGNTEKVAKTIAQELSGFKVVSVSNSRVEDLDVDLIIVGSPTLGGRPKIELKNFLDQIPNASLRNKKVAVFDTRFQESAQNFALRLLMKTIGYAAPKIAETLVSKGAILIAPPQGFIVTAKKGPLADGELTRATNWAKSIQNL